jgi:hypothetical protein
MTTTRNKNQDKERKQVKGKPIHATNLASDHKKGIRLFACAQKCDDK